MWGLVEGQGCVCNVNRLKATDRIARGEGLIRSHIPSERCLMILFYKADMRRIYYKLKKNKSFYVHHKLPFQVNVHFVHCTQPWFLNPQTKP